MVSLRQVKSTLEELAIFNMDGPVGDTKYVFLCSTVDQSAQSQHKWKFLTRQSSLEIYPFGSFADFPNLKSINAELRMLVGGVEHSNLPTPNNDRETNYPYPRSISLIAALPSSIERLELGSCRPDETSTLLELLDHIDSFPHLKHLEIQWQDVPYNPDFSKPFIHPGFSAAERVKFESQCSAAGVELKTSGGRLPSKTLYHWYDHTVKLTDGQQPAYVRYTLEYPYQGWEKLCEEFECDPATGYRFDMPHGIAAPRWPPLVGDGSPSI